MMILPFPTLSIIIVVLRANSMQSMLHFMQTSKVKPSNSASGMAVDWKAFLCRIVNSCKLTDESGKKYMLNFPQKTKCTNVYNA